LPVRCGEPRPAADAGRRDHHARRRDAAAPLPHGLGLLRPRYLQPRALWRARLADRRPGVRAGGARLRHRPRPPGRHAALVGRAADARHGRRDGDPGDPDRDRAGGAVARQPADRDPRHRHPGDPSCHAPGARAGTHDPRGAVRRGGDIARHADREDHVRTHPAEHRGAAHRAGHLHRRLCHPHRGCALLPRGRLAARYSDLGEHHGRRAGAVRRLPAQRLLPRRVPCRDRAGGQHAGGRLARHAGSEDGQAPMSVLQLDNLTVTLPKGGDRPNAVEGVSFAVEKNEILCLVGESGSGKSVIAQAIMGLLPKTLRVASGKVRLQGRAGMVFQEPMTSLNPVMRCGDQVDEAFHRSGLAQAERKSRALSLLREVALPDPERILDSYPHQLSGGQRQRVMIAMALALEPALLVADEPTTALDVTTQAQILKLILQLQAAHGMAVLFITHDFGVVAEIAQRVAVLREGRLVETGACAEVLTRPREAYTRMLIRAVPTLQPRPRRAPKDAPTVLETKGLSKTYLDRHWL